LSAAACVQKVLIHLPVRKPDKAWFVRTHPDPTYHMPVAMLDLKADREAYAVHPKLLPALAGETCISRQTVFLAINRQGEPFIWPVKMPGPDGRSNSWTRTAMEAAMRAATSWVRVQANMSLGSYSVEIARAQWPEPTWPEMTFLQLLGVAFRDTLI